MPLPHGRTLYVTGPVFSSTIATVHQGRSLSRAATCCFFLSMVLRASSWIVWRPSLISLTASPGSIALASDSLVATSRAALPGCTASRPNSILNGVKPVDSCSVVRYGRSLSFKHVRHFAHQFVDKVRAIVRNDLLGQPMSSDDHFHECPDRLCSRWCVREDLHLWPLREVILNGFVCFGTRHTSLCASVAGQEMLVMQPQCFGAQRRRHKQQRSMLLVLRQNPDDPIEYALTRETSVHSSRALMIRSRSVTEDEIIVLQHEGPSLQLAIAVLCKSKRSQGLVIRNELKSFTKQDGSNGVVTCVCFEHECLLEVRQGQHGRRDHPLFECVEGSPLILAPHERPILLCQSLLRDQETKDRYLSRKEDTLGGLHFDVCSLEEVEYVKYMPAMLLKETHRHTRPLFLCLSVDREGGFGSVVRMHLNLPEARCRIERREPRHALEGLKTSIDQGRGVARLLCYLIQPSAR
ncbi:unnamed protein product [Vitrella brassicaformis CCMP3155]|uniref:Uncharacterized protein n=1 Tax=Vitrella brassicaformis (strain CCMP3155) TaxID=1169540 RepID=A0A0G4FEN1_VITBC|nr:unnamed protein product [Vitrella brassicaformis CCMP3155]|eukprot:CEM11450.1 unnamed protein product [Vitrella brassicaformis CCMP3155]